MNAEPCSISSPPAAKQALNQPLPSEVIPGMTWGPFRYRRYPVFSLPWLQRRTLSATVVVVLYGAFAALAHIAAKATWPNALAMASYFVAGALLMLTVGPALATWVRHRGLKPRAEGACVILAVVLGFILAAAADGWASSGIMRSMATKNVPADQQKISDVDKAKLSLFVVGGLFIYFAVSGGLASLAYFAERRRLRARSLHLAALDADMRLAVLQAQIEPHFLFNTLASIRPLIRQDPSRAEDALDALAEHLRATIPQMRSTDGRLMSTLGQQLDICASYLALMQVRMGARLQYDIEAMADLRAKTFPPMTLLSLVENAIKHGIEPRPGPGRILIRAAAAGGRLSVSVADDGQGLKEGLNSGLGLANIREQLQVRYGDHARLKIAARPEGGTMAEIIVPLVSTAE